MKIFIASIALLASLALPQAALAARVSTGNGVTVDVPAGVYAQAGHIELVDTTDGSIWAADGCWTFLPEGGKVASGVYAHKMSELFPGELTRPCEWTKLEVSEGTAQAAPDDQEPAPAPQGPPPPQRRLLPATGGFFKAGEMVDAFAFLFTDTSYVPDGPCYMLVTPKDGWGYDGVVWPRPKELDNKNPCPPPVMLPSTQPQQAQQASANPASPPPPPPAPPAKPNTPNGCPTINCLERHDDPNGAGIPFKKDEAVNGWIKFKTGRNPGRCYTLKATEDGVVTAGVTNWWWDEDTRVKNDPQC